MQPTGLSPKPAGSRRDCAAQPTRNPAHLSTCARSTTRTQGPPSQPPARMKPGSGGRPCPPRVRSTRITNATKPVGQASVPARPCSLAHTIPPSPGARLRRSRLHALPAIACEAREVSGGAGLRACPSLQIRILNSSVGQLSEPSFPLQVGRASLPARLPPLRRRARRPAATGAVAKCATGGSSARAGARKAARARPLSSPALSGARLRPSRLHHRRVSRQSCAQQARCPARATTRRNAPDRAAAAGGRSAGCSRPSR